MPLPVNDPLKPKICRCGAEYPGRRNSKYCPACKVIADGIVKARIEVNKHRKREQAKAAKLLENWALLKLAQPPA